MAYNLPLKYHPQLTLKWHQRNENLQLNSNNFLRARPSRSKVLWFFMCCSVWGCRGRSRLYIFFIIGNSCFNQGLSHSIFFSDVQDIFSRHVQVYSPLRFLTNTTNLATYSSHSLLLLLLLLVSTHSLIDWIPKDSLICWLLILSIFILPTIFLSIFISFTTNIWVFFFCVSSPVSSAMS